MNNSPLRDYIIKTVQDAFNIPTRHPIDYPYQTVLQYAQRLASALHAKHYASNTAWKPGDTIAMVIDQIDNMTSDLVRNDHVKSMIEAANQIRNMVDTARNDPANRENDYLRGYANGLILALATLDGTEPQFIDIPAPQPKPARKIHVVFKPQPNSGGGSMPDLVFIDVNNDAAESINAGDWIADGEYEALVIDLDNIDLRPGSKTLPTQTPIVEKTDRIGDVEIRNRIYEENVQAATAAQVSPPPAVDATPAPGYPPGTVMLYQGGFSGGAAFFEYAGSHFGNGVNQHRFYHEAKHGGFSYLASDCRIVTADDMAKMREAWNGARPTGEFKFEGATVPQWLLNRLWPQPDAPATPPAPIEGSITHIEPHEFVTGKNWPEFCRVCGHVKDRSCHAVTVPSAAPGPVEHRQPQRPFTVPDGHVALRDAEGRATGETAWIGPYSLISHPAERNGTEHCKHCGWHVDNIIHAEPFGRDRSHQRSAIELGRKIPPVATPSDNDPLKELEQIFAEMPGSIRNVTGVDNLAPARTEPEMIITMNEDKN